MDQVIELLLRQHPPRRAISLTEAESASRVAGRTLAHLGMLDSCLTRSLVTASLLSGSESVMLHIGFRPNDQGVGPAPGHAWVTIHGEHHRRLNDEETRRWTISKSYLFQRSAR